MKQSTEKEASTAESEESSIINLDSSVEIIEQVEEEKSEILIPETVAPVTECIPLLPLAASSPGPPPVKDSSAESKINTEASTNLKEPNSNLAVESNNKPKAGTSTAEEQEALKERKLGLRPRKIEHADETGSAKKARSASKKPERRSTVSKTKSQPNEPALLTVGENTKPNEGMSPPDLPVEETSTATSVETTTDTPVIATPILECAQREMPMLLSETVNDVKTKIISNCSSSKTSGSDARISPTSDTNSQQKVVKKRKRKREMWNRKKKSNGHGKCNGNDMLVSNSVRCRNGSSSPSLSESSASKRRHCSDSSDSSQKKSREFVVPSPSLADINMKAAIPESTATSVEVSKTGFCLCRKKPQVFISGNNNAGDLYCQGLDCIDTRVVGCCNPIPSQDVGLFRASEKTSYQMLCNVHQQRLLRHNCCPGCGLFCTQGKYLMCKYKHHFHKACWVENDNEMVPCPHCGDDAPPKIVSISLHSSKDPVFLPQQRPPRMLQSAKMSITRSMKQIIEEDIDPIFNFPYSILNIQSNEQLTTAGPPQSVNRDKLAHLLNIACRSFSAFSRMCCSNRYTVKSLYNAAHCGDVEKLLKMMASGLNPNHVFEDCGKQTALHVAAANGHLAAVHILLQAQAQINALDSEQNTPLSVATTSKHNDVVKYLIKCGADLLLKSEDGMCALHIAAKCGNLGACFHLLNSPRIPPKYIDSLDDGAWTPMVWASEFNHLDVVKFLMSKGADSLIRDAEQNIALHWAAFGGSIEIVELYLNSGSDINAVNVHGDTPLHIASRQDKYSCVLLLLARGAKSDMKNKAGELPRDCTESPESDIYKGISLNMEISSLLTRFQERTPKIISNDITRGKERNPIQCVNGVDDEQEPRDYMYVSESCFTSKISVDRTITSLQYCKCADSCNSDACNCANISIKSWYDHEGRLKPDFNYADPPMIFECNQACQCNRITCHNRVVQNGLSCRFQLFRTEDKGWGIKTLNLIPKGTYVCEYMGEIISDCEADHREDDSYLFDLDNRDEETYCIDARHYGNFARFINHMCAPNLMPVHVFVEHQDLRFPRIAFFANRDILPEEELGYNYGEKFWVIKWKSFTCTCNAEKCIYSEKTIKSTLENYNRKLLEDGM